METPERPASSFAPLPKNERSKLRKKSSITSMTGKNQTLFLQRKRFFSSLLRPGGGEEYTNMVHQALSLNYQHRYIENKN